MPMPVTESATKATADVGKTGVELLVSDASGFVGTQVDKLALPVFGALSAGLTIKLSLTKDYVYVPPPSEDEEEEVDTRFDGVSEFEEKEEPRYGGAFMKTKKRPSSDEE